MSRMWMRGLGLGLLGFAALAGGCSQHSERDWNGAPVALMSSEAPASMEGRWEGSWEKNTNYDRGLAHCVIIAVPPPADSTQKDKLHYMAHFTLWHYDLAPEDFSVLFSVTSEREGKINFYGKRALEANDGMSKFDGFVENNKLFVTFVSRRDYGTVTMRHLAN